MTLSTNIYAEVVTTFPASVVGAGGISIAKSGGAYTIAFVGADIALNSIALESIEHIATDRLLGRDTGAAGKAEQLTVGGGIEFTGAGGIQRSALTGAVTAAAGSNATTIANDAVGSDQIAAGAVTSIEIADAAVGTDQIAANAVTLAKLATQADATILANVSGGAAVPAANGLSAILDDILGSAQGSVIYRGGSAWAVLGPGTNGQILKTGGAAANPAWGDAVAASSDAFRGEIATSVGSSALTISLKNIDGDDPSAGTPVSLLFRSSSLASGDITRVDITAALSFTISSGSTLGTSSNTPFRLWVVAFDDLGTVRLGVINCSVAGTIHPLCEWTIASSSAEGGAGAADSAGVFYTGTAVGSKSFVVLGFVTYESGLTTAGTWASTPTVIQSYRPGVPLPGDIIQSRTATYTTQDSTTSSSFTVTGLTVSISPKSAANRVSVQAAGSLVIGTQNKNGHATITRGGSAIGSFLGAFSTTGGAVKSPVSLLVTDSPGSTSSTAYAVAIKNTDGTTTIQFPGSGGGNEGGVITATELMG